MFQILKMSVDLSSFHEIKRNTEVQARKMFDASKNALSTMFSANDTKLKTLQAENEKLHSELQTLRNSQGTAHLHGDQKQERCD